MMDIQQFAIAMLKRNPEIRNNQNAKEMIDCIEKNDASRGEQIANNILNSRGVSRNEAVSQARNFFSSFGL